MPVRKHDLIAFEDFRKSKSKVCQGFKLHVLGDALSGLILALNVTPGGHHDSTQAHPLIKSSHKGLGKVDFDLDFDAMVAICPGGVATSK